VALYQFLKSRKQVADKLAALRGKGCWIDVVYSEGDSTVKSVLDDAGIQSLACKFPNVPGPAGVPPLPAGAGTPGVGGANARGEGRAHTREFTVPGSRSGTHGSRTGLTVRR
jgi:hypothetical protein